MEVNNISVYRINEVPSFNQNTISRESRIYSKKYELIIRVIIIVYIIFELLKCKILGRNKISSKEVQIVTLTTLLTAVGFDYSSALNFSFQKSYTSVVIISLFEALVLTSHEFRHEYNILYFDSSVWIVRLCHLVLFILIFSNFFYLLFTVIILAVAIIIIPIFYLFHHLNILRILRVVPQNRSTDTKKTLSSKHIKMLRGEFYQQSCSKDIESINSLPTFIDTISLDYPDRATRSYEPFTFLKSIQNKSKNLPTNKIPEKRIKDAPTCAICYVKFERNAYILKLPVCNHTFHWICVINWLKKSPSCPCCRFDFNSYFILNYPELT